MPQKCIFCQILKGEQESERVYEGKNVLGMLDIRPSAPGHTLVVPKEHVKTLSDLSESMIGALFNGVKEVIWKLEESLDPDGFNVGWNQGKAAGQGVPHLHVHVIPRYEGDKGGRIEAVVRNEPEEDISSIAERIRSGSKPSKQRSKVARDAEKRRKGEEKEEGKEEEKEEKEEIPDRERSEEGEKPKTSRPDLESIPGSEDELLGSHAEPTPQEVEKEEREEEEEEEEESDEKKKWKEMKKPRY